MELKKRQIVSSLLIISSIIVILSGVVLYIAPSRYLAFVNHWNLLGIERGLFVDIHVIFGIIMILSITYLLINKKDMFWEDKNDKEKKKKS